MSVNSWVSAGEWTFNMVDKSVKCLSIDNRCCYPPSQAFPHYNFHCKLNWSPSSTFQRLTFIDAALWAITFSPNRSVTQRNGIDIEIYLIRVYHRRVSVVLGFSCLHVTFLETQILSPVRLDIMADDQKPSASTAKTSLRQEVIISHPESST